MARKTKTRIMYDNLKIGDTIYINCFQYQTKQPHPGECGMVPALMVAKIVKKNYCSGKVINIGLKVNGKRVGWDNFYIPHALTQVSKNEKTARSRLEKALKLTKRHYNKIIKFVDEKLESINNGS